MIKSHTLNVKAIENGTVIDHIPAGEGLNILHYFALNELPNCVTVGFNLVSKTQLRKDLIKIEEIFFSEEQIQQIAFFAPKATINIIKQFKVVAKIIPTYPDKVTGIFTCPNLNCASHGEPVKSYFYVYHQSAGKPKLKCHFCEKTFPFEGFINKN